MTHAHFCIAAIALLAASPALGEGDAARGAQLFRQCAACHSVRPGEHLTGPSLARIWRQPAAARSDFARYSDALKHAHLVWDEATLDKWLAEPEKLVPGTSMTFPGLKEPTQRHDVMAYLKSVAEGNAPPSPRAGMNMRREPLDLKSAPPEGQVTSVQHCRDTYTIGTADGQTQKIWEFNLRLKTDSSARGPRPGKPVVIGAGMQGDRASLVFASPREISVFIKESCS